MKTTVEVIGPKEASKYLERNQNNRPVRKSTVRRYAETMRRGQWKLTPEPIAFDTNGELINGQHRLAAVVESEATIQCVVARGVDPEAFAVIDSGVSRSMGDRLAQVGVAYSTVAATALRMVLLYRGAPDIRWAGGLAAANRLLKTSQEILELAEQYGEEALLEAGTLSWRAGGMDVRLNRSATYAVYLLLKEADPNGTMLKEFYRGIVSGEGLVRDDPRLTLRRWAANQAGRQGKGQRTMVAEIKAWNAFVKGEPLKQIKWVPGEPMPSIVSVANQKAAVAR